MHQNQGLPHAAGDCGPRAGRTAYPVNLNAKLQDMLTACDIDLSDLGMVGLLPGEALMQPRLCGLGMQSLELPAGELRGHTFHHSRLETALEPWKRGQRQNGRGDGECVYRKASIVASYLPLSFPGNPAAAASLFRPAACKSSG